MAITINQYASTPNMANADLVWEVSSNQSTQPQYQYICVLKDGCNNTLTTVKQQPNPSGYGVFDLGRLVKQYLSYDAEKDLFEGGVDGYFQASRNTAKFFKVVFGEEYGTSPSSSVNVYNGITNATTGSPAYSGSTANYYFINGVLDPNYGSFNWNTSSFFIPRLTPSSQSFDYNVCLTDAPRTQYARSTDYLTVSALNGNFNANTTSSQDIYAMQVTLYTASGVYFDEEYYNVANSGVNPGPRTTDVQLFSSVSTINVCTSSLGQNRQTSGSLLIHMTIGPQNISNLLDHDLTTIPWTHYTVRLTNQRQTGSEPFGNPSGSWDEFTIYKTDGACEYNGVRFAFINNYGVWDWYTFTLADAKQYGFDRGIYKQNFVNYSTRTTSVTYDRTRRGNDTFYTNISEDFTANSDWLTQEEADWLEQLFYSPNVYIQDGLTMLPVILTSGGLTTKTNPRTQKNYQLTITYQLANSKRSR